MCSTHFIHGGESDIQCKLRILEWIISQRHCTYEGVVENPPEKSQIRQWQWSYPWTREELPYSIFPPKDHSLYLASANMENEDLSCCSSCHQVESRSVPLCHRVMECVERKSNNLGPQMLPACAQAALKRCCTLVWQMQRPGSNFTTSSKLTDGGNYAVYRVANSPKLIDSLVTITTMSQGLVQSV